MRRSVKERLLTVETTRYSEFVPERRHTPRTGETAHGNWICECRQRVERNVRDRPVPLAFAAWSAIWEMKPSGEKRRSRLV